MRMSGRMLAIAALCAWPLFAMRAEASVRPCEFPEDGPQPSALRLRIAQEACREHDDWFSPFINGDGRVGWEDGHVPMEAELSREKLKRGSRPWRRVADYWGPLLSDLEEINGAAECRQSSGDWRSVSLCRAFILDNPWSAAFVSHVMRTAGVGGFRSASRHIVYIFDAYDPASSRRRYRLVAPDAERPEVGDLLCYSREPDTVATHRELIAFFERGGRSLDTHCDIVVGANLNGDSKLYLIGGNLLHTVMMRKLSLNAAGRFSPPARREGPCRMNEERACSLNAKAWVALLKLRE